MEVATKFVPIFNISIQIEISNEQPEVIIIDMKIKELVHKMVSSRLSTRAINNNKVPGAMRLSRDHGKGDFKRVFLNSTSSENLRGPADKNTTRGTNNRALITTVKPFGRKIPNKLQIHHFSFSFLEAENICIAFFYFVLNRISFLPIIQTPGIPTKNIPGTLIHCKQR
jgi:hypothetical protein